ncbi:MAG: phospholipase C [Nakamurella sp.]
MHRSNGRALARKTAVVAALSGLAALSLTAPSLASANSDTQTLTPIKHVVVIYGENVSFDHYFGTYPHAVNPAGEPAFRPAAGTPSVNGLTPALLTANPNSANPTRLDRSEALTCDQDHNYTAEQKAFDRGLMDKFVENTQRESCAAPNVGKPGLVMDYYDGNTVTGMWNYAQHFAMSDNSYGTTFGPSTPGALNLISGQTHGVTARDATGKQVPDSYVVTNPDANGVGTEINDPDPYYDDCSSPKFNTAVLNGRNVGDLLNAKNVSWGWFQGGFRPTKAYDAKTGSKAQCATSHRNIGGVSVTDYVAHRQPFNYYPSTANPHHLAPASVAEVGHAGRANHQYDLTDFWHAVDGNNMPAVSYLKAGDFQSGHAGSSDPIDEQHFVVNTINRLETSRQWKSTAVVLAYDDSDGWYDHQMSPVVNDSQSAQDALTADGMCGARTPLAGYQDRCGYGPRVPLLVVSPYSRVNAVDHAITDQTSVLRFIEDNWGLGRLGDGSFDALAGSLDNLFAFGGHHRAKPLYLDPRSGLPIHHRR